MALTDKIGRILVVDDDEDILTAGRLLLRRHVYAGDYDWSGLSDEERQRRYRELYARRRAFKGLPPVDFDEDGAIEGEPRG